MAIDLDAPARGLTAPEPEPKSLRGPLTVAVACFVVWGLAYGLLDVLNKHFQETLHVGKAQSTWLQMAYFGAYLTMSLPAGVLLQARGYKFGLVFGLTVTGTGALLFIPSAHYASFPFFVGSIFVLAAGLCFLETSANTYVNVLGSPEQAPRRLNLAQSFTALGIFVGLLIGGTFFFQGGDPAQARATVQTTYLVIAVAVLIFAAAITRASLPELGAGHGLGRLHEDACRASHRPANLSRPHFVFGLITQAFYVGAQAGCGAFFINLVTETWPGLTSRDGAFLLSIAGAGSVVGRFATTGLLMRFRPTSVLAAYGLVNVLLCLVVAAGVAKVSAIALMAVFFFMSTMFPTIFTLGLTGLGPDTKRGASVMMLAVGGGVVLPYPMGRIAEAYGTPAAFLLPAACFAVVALYGARGAKSARAA
jgi:FHS family L-fucose permease-like MFS transporter